MEPIAATPAQWRQRKRRVDVDGVDMAYVDVGEGDPVVLLHGNPTSSFVWRHVVAHVAAHARCIAPDLVGHGDSGRLPHEGPSAYRFSTHRDYLEGFLDSVGVASRVTLVVHDWGSALGFDWANRHRDAIVGLAYMEALVRPLEWDEWPPAEFFRSLRSSAGESMVLDRNLFVERVLPASIQRRLSADEMDEYRRPFAQPGESRRPTLTWAREVPLGGEPSDVAAVVADYARWLASSDVPKLFVNADPGAILVGAQREHCRTWPNQTEVTVDGIHFVQEDSGELIGRAVAEWLPTRRR